MSAIILTMILMTPSFLNSNDLVVERTIMLDESKELPNVGTIRNNVLTKNFEDLYGIFWASFAYQLETGTVKDVDGNIYRTVKIGDQWWMAENLKTGKYRNGDDITFIGNDDLGDWKWQAANYGAWCLNRRVVDYETVYGKLYNGHAVNDSRGICPIGWHVPSDDVVGGDSEWQILLDYLGSNAGVKMKDSSIDHWIYASIMATNESGFTALPGGYRMNEGDFYGLGYEGFWWSSSSFKGTLNYLMVSTFSGPVQRYRRNQEHGFSVRCVRD